MLGARGPLEISPAFGLRLVGAVQRVEGRDAGVGPFFCAVRPGIIERLHRLPEPPGFQQAGGDIGGDAGYGSGLGVDPGDEGIDVALGIGDFL